MINVILADHERIFRIGLASALAAEDDIRIIGQPPTPVQLVRSIRSFRPHVVLLSTAFLSHIDSIKQACELRNTAILLLQDYGASACDFDSGDFHGVMLRSTSEATVVDYIRHVARGGRVLRLNSSPVSGQQDDFVGIRVRERLSARELVIISCVVQGCKNREIAFQTGSTEQSVKNALRKIYDKTGMCGRLELALFVVHHRTLLNVPVAALASITDRGTLPGVVEITRPPSVN